MFKTGVPTLRGNHRRLVSCLFIIPLLTVADSFPVSSQNPSPAQAPVCTPASGSVQAPTQAHGPDL